MYNSSNSSYGSHYRHRGHSVNNKFTSLVRNRPVGLQNLTNTCYISGILQILFLIIPESINKNKGRVTELFFQLKDSKKTQDYKLFKRAVEKQIEIVQGYEQQDAQEFLISFLELLNQENTLGLKRQRGINLDYNEKQSIDNNYKHFMKEMLKIQNSKIIDLFSAELIRRFTCPKDHTKFKFERYQCLSVNFPDSASSSKSSYLRYSNITPEVELEELIAKSISAQEISGLLCEKCKKKTTFKKQTFLYTTPNFLFLHLARFKLGSYTNQKINTVVQYQEFMEMYDQSIKNKVKYRLIGTVNHYGTLNRGHYYAEIKWSDGHWYEVNDEDVRSCQVYPTGNRSKYVYILCYEKMK